MSRAHGDHEDGRRWHLNDLLAIELFVVVTLIAVLATVATMIYWDDLRRAQISAAWNFLRTMNLLWIEEHATRGEVSSDAIAYLRERSGAPAAGAESEGSALGSVRGLEALRSRAARVEPGTGGQAADETKSRQPRIGLSDGVPTVIVHRRYLAAPALIEFRPAMASEQSPVVSWVCGSDTAPAGWYSPQPRGPQVPEIYLPSVCRQRIAK